MSRSYSAGLVLFRRVGRTVELMLVHPGGPFWAKKDEHGWSIPKGEFDPEAEAALEAAEREFAEELGAPAPAGERLALPEFKAGSKVIVSWLIEADFDAEGFSGAESSNRFETEWPPKSGRMQSFPEVDRAAWFSLDLCRTKLHKGQVVICDLVADSLLT